MKKLSTLLFALFLILSPIQNVHAATPSATLVGPTMILAGQQFTVDFGVAGVTNLQGGRFTLAYDSSKLTFISSLPADLDRYGAVLDCLDKNVVHNGCVDQNGSYQGYNSYNITVGTRIVFDGPAKSGTLKIAPLIFKAKSSFAVGQSTVISVNSIEYSDGTDHTLPNKSITIKMVSDNSYLKSLSVSSGTLSFAKATTGYTVVVENNVSSITIGASAESGQATVSGAGTKTLAIYSNIFNIVVTAGNGSKRTYTIDVQRKDEKGLASPPSTNNNLASITVDGFDAFNAAFDKTNITYTLEVGNLVTDLTITAPPEDAKSKVEITKAPLNLGSNTVTIKVTAESGDIKTYTITVNRSSDVPTVDESEIIAALGKVTTDKIGLNAPLSGEISTEILTALKTSGKTLVVVEKIEGKTVYEWLIDGSKITDTAPIKTKILFESDLKGALDQLTNYAQGIILNFEENATLPENTSVKLYVSNSFKDGDKLTLYYYNAEKNKLSVSAKDLVVEGGIVEFSLAHTSVYFLSPTQIKIPGIMDYLFVIISVIEAFFIIFLLITRGKSRKVERDLSVN
jgi:hypothetical protein